jgi:Holliday junction resolvase RusA-like endonuclease
MVLSGGARARDGTAGEVNGALHLEIRGNHLDPQGNAIPYERMTTRSKWADPRALRYIAWKSFIQTQWWLQTGKKLPHKKNARYRLDVICYFKTGKKAGTCSTHADPENVRKGIQDALFHVAGDKHVVGLVDCFHVERDPKVVITVGEEGEGLKPFKPLNRRKAPPLKRPDSGIGLSGTKWLSGGEAD